MKNRFILIGIIACVIFANFSCQQATSPEPCVPVPTENQLRWQQMEFYAFVHFSLNTYTDQSWGYGNEDIKLFNPEELDCRQWARICKESGMKGIIITAKHHSGFCLWPSAYTEYSVKNAPWKNGKGDVVREMADACREYGLKLGIYVSPWDRNHPDYGKPEYISYFRSQITELLTNYGEIFEIWFDGANGGDGYYGGANETRKIDRTTYYDWGNTYSFIRKLQPNIVIWNDGGDRGDLRWVGTEEGYVGETNWSLLNDTGEVEWGMLHYGLETGNAWVPAEVNTSIRPEWFYHPNEDNKVKTVSKLLETYYNSVGRNASLLLNFPIMPNGLIHETDEKTALEFGRIFQKTFSSNLANKAKASATNFRRNVKAFSPVKAIDSNDNSFWTTDDSVKSASITIDFGKPVLFNRLMLQEYIRLGQRVKAFSLEALIDGDWKEISKGTTIGYKRILRFSAISTSKIRINITDSKCSPAISNIGVFNAPVILDAPDIYRNQSGEISISSADIGSYFFYTTNGSEPNPQSAKYTQPVWANGKVEVRAIAYDPTTGLSSPVTTEKFDVVRKDWKIAGISDSDAANILDGNPRTSWALTNLKNKPAELIIDLAAEYNLTGFKYLPDQNRWPAPIITNYQFFVSADNASWKMVSQGEFSNIQNNPVMQIRNFSPAKARYIKLKTLNNANGTNHSSGYAEIDILTN